MGIHLRNLLVGNRGNQLLGHITAVTGVKSLASHENSEPDRPWPTTET